MVGYRYADWTSCLNGPTQVTLTPSREESYIMSVL